MTDRQRIRKQILKKCIREQDKLLAIHAFWRAIKSAAGDHMHNDGLVEWEQIKEEFNEIFKELGITY